VYIEALTLGLPIITTIPVSDDFLNIENYAIIVEKEEEKIYNVLKDFLEGKVSISKKFEPENYNKLILEKLNKLFDS
jgi:23S rRNA maturation-related 3'-5' exoribonuclease YhaM